MARTWRSESKELGFARRYHVQRRRPCLPGSCSRSMRASVSHRDRSSPLRVSSSRCTFRFTRGKWKASTAMTEEERIQVHLVKGIGSMLMSKITREDLQKFLGKKAKALARGGVDHLRFRLRSIFTLAISEGVVDRNPATSLYTPRNCQKGVAKRILTPEQINKLMGGLEIRERLVVQFATYEGMRPGDPRPSDGRCGWRLRLGSPAAVQGQYRPAQDTPLRTPGGSLGVDRRVAPSMAGARREHQW